MKEGKKEEERLVGVLLVLIGVYDTFV